MRAPASFFKDKLTMKLPGGAGYRPHLDGYFRWRITLTHVETEPGDVVYFDWRNVHGSAANHSTGSRRILYGTYNRSAEGEHLETYYEDKRGSLEPIARKSLG